jgi:two-component system, LytTR family, sensor kinase
MALNFLSIALLLDSTSATLRPSNSLSWKSKISSIPEGISFRDPLIINAIGHTAGLFLFGLMILLMLQDWKRNGIRQTKLSLLAATLALLWNLGALFILSASSNNPASPDAWMSFGFSVLSLLPAVLLQLVLRGRLRWITSLGYLISASSIILHIVENYSLSLPLHQVALIAIAAGFGALTIGAAISIQKRVDLGSPRDFSDLISLACLFAFSVSLIHFGYGHSGSTWKDEIAWHHAGIPLALIVLLQDYRFLLLDAFIRFLFNLGLAAAYILSVVFIGTHFHLWQTISQDRFVLGVVSVLACLSLILLIFVRNALEEWLTKRIFRRRSADVYASQIEKLALRCESEESLVERAVTVLAEFAATSKFEVQSISKPDSPRSSANSRILFGRLYGDKVSNSYSWVEARIPLRFSQGDEFLILLGSRKGGRRYLSADLGGMRRLGGIIVEQIERFRSQQLRSLVSQAELRALQAQINPHFLFNALNTLYGTIDRQSHQARRMVLNLAEIFRYFLHTDRTMIALDEELRIVKAYLEIEALRLGDRLQTELTVCESARSVQIPVLSIQPLVENAVKHGISPQSGSGTVRLTVTEASGGIRVAIEDTGKGFQGTKEQGSRTGVGLDNVRQRLRLCFGAGAEPEINSGASGTVVSFFVPRESMASPLSGYR